MDRLTRLDVLSGTLLLALSVFYYAGTLDLPSARDEPGPAFFPRLLAGALFLLAGTILVSGLRGRGAREEPGPFVKPVLLMVLTLAYAGAYVAVGLVPATLVYSLGVAYVLGRRDLPGLLATAGGTTALLYAALGFGLGIPL